MILQRLFIKSDDEWGRRGQKSQKIDDTFYERPYNATEEMVFEFVWDSKNDSTWRCSKMYRALKTDNFRMIEQK